MTDKSSMGKHIKRIATVNVLLFLYFVSTSFSCFLILAVGLFVVATDSPYQTFKNLLGCKCEQQPSTSCLNKSYKAFSEFSVVQQAMGILVFKLALEASWYVPTWLIIFLAAEIFACWTLLQDFGIINLLKQHHLKVHEQLNKVAQMIPKYKSE